MDLKKVMIAEYLCDCEKTLIWPIIFMRLKPMMFVSEAPEIHYYQDDKPDWLKS